MNASFRASVFSKTVTVRSLVVENMVNSQTGIAQGRDAVVAITSVFKLS